MNWEDYTKAHIQAMDDLSSETMSAVHAVLQEVRDSNSTIWIAGNGGSAASASHAVADFSKTSTSGGKGAVRAIALSELISLSTALANDISFESAMGEALKLMAKPNDVLLVISVSGSSPNLIFALDTAKVLGLRSISLVGANGSVAARKSDIAIVVNSGDYQVVENMHMLLIHWFVKELI